MKSKKYLFVFSLLFVIFTLSACNAIGLGTDYEATSNALNEFEEELEDFEDELEDFEDDLEATQAALSGDFDEMPVVIEELPVAEEPDEVDEPFIDEPAEEEEEPLRCSDSLGCVEYGPADPIRIAAALMISGSFTDLGYDSLYGIEIAIDFQGEIFGHAIELQVEDDGCSAEGGQLAGMEIVSDPSIIAVVGPTCSGAALGMSPIISDAGYVMVSPSNTSPAITDPNETWNPGYLRTAYNDKVQAVAMADFAIRILGASTAATIHDGGAYTESLASEFMDAFERMGGEIVAFIEVNYGDTDMLPVLNAVAAGGVPDFLYYPVFSETCISITQQAAEVAALSYTALAAADGCFYDYVADQMGDSGEGMFFSSIDLDFEGPDYDEFKAYYLDKYGGTVPLSVFHAHAFDATNMIFGCIQEVALIGNDGSLLIGRQDMRSCLYAARNFNGLSGTLTCDEYGDCADPRILISILEDGELLEIYP